MSEDQTGEDQQGDKARRDGEKSSWWMEAIVWTIAEFLGNAVKVVVGLFVALISSCS
jgi:hypothetical protein